MLLFIQFVVVANIMCRGLFEPLLFDVITGALSSLVIILLWKRAMVP